MRIEIPDCVYALAGRTKEEIAACFLSGGLDGKQIVDCN